MKFLVLNGPNINMLGLREPEIYGKTTYIDLVNYIQDVCRQNNVEAEFFQSNHEGALVDAIQSAYNRIDGIIINPAAYTHTSVAILDALSAVNLPSAEVHISDVYKREAFRHTSYAGMACSLHFIGQGIEGYKNAVIALKNQILEKREKEAMQKKSAPMQHRIPAANVLEPQEMQLIEEPPALLEEKQPKALLNAEEAAPVVELQKVMPAAETAATQPPELPIAEEPATEPVAETLPQGEEKRNTPLTQDYPEARRTEYIHYINNVKKIEETKQ